VETTEANVRTPRVCGPRTRAQPEPEPEPELAAEAAPHRPLPKPHRRYTRSPACGPRAGGSVP